MLITRFYEFTRKLSFILFFISVYPLSVHLISLDSFFRRGECEGGIGEGVLRDMGNRFASAKCRSDFCWIGTAGNERAKPNFPLSLSLAWSSREWPFPISIYYPIPRGGVGDVAKKFFFQERADFDCFRSRMCVYACWVFSQSIGWIGDYWDSKRIFLRKLLFFVDFKVWVSR